MAGVLELAVVGGVVGVGMTCPAAAGVGVAAREVVVGGMVAEGSAAVSGSRTLQELSRKTAVAASAANRCLLTMADDLTGRATPSFVAGS